jgi:hypothetical protein
MLKARAFRFLVPLLILILGYLFGAYSHSQALWPINVLIKMNNESIAKELGENFDQRGAFSNLKTKNEVDCPEQSDSVAVILVLGQSNSGNHAEVKHSTQYPNSVLNYFSRKCFSAQSPLLGASGLEGEYLTLVGDKLINDGRFRSVVIVNESIGGTTVANWARKGPLSKNLFQTLGSLDLKYKVTHVIWHQGESDFMARTSYAEYRNSFLSLKDSLSQNGVDAPILLVVSTICGFDPEWKVNNTVAEAQRSLINNRDVFLAFDADSDLSAIHRRPQTPAQEPNCHLSKIGQETLSDAISRKILILSK